MHLYSIDYRDAADLSHVAVVAAQSEEQAFEYLVSDEDIQGVFGQDQPDMSQITEIDRNAVGVILIR